MIKLTKTSSHTLDRIFIFGLFALFCTTSCLLVFMGARQYRNISTLMWKNQELRTASAYLRETFQEYDSSHSVSLTEQNGIPVISFFHTEEPDSITYIYAYDGSLRELVQAKSSAFSPDLGIPIAAIEDLEIEQFGNNLYYITLTDNFGNLCPIYISQNAD